MTFVCRKNAVVKIPEPHALPKPDVHRSITAVLPDRWTMRLQLAATAAEIVRVANDFLASWDRAELARLPADCRPPAIQSIDDITRFAYTLRQAQLAFEGPLGTGLLLDRMTVFFAYASTRCAQLSHLSRARA